MNHTLRSPLIPAVTGAALALLLVLPVVSAPPSLVEQTLPLISAGRFVEAQAELSPYVKAHPEDLSARYWLGRALLGAGQREAAIEQFQTVLKSRPASSDTRLYLAQALWELRRPAEALAQLQELLRRDSRHALAKAMLVRLQRGEAPDLPIEPDLAGGQIGFVNGGLPIDPGNVDLQTYHRKDYTFSEAPSEWLVTCGTWATTNRWTCSPAWSWYGGFAQGGPAAIWTKEEFAGDQVVEAYFGFKMGLEGAQLTYGNVPSAYKSGADVCITMCGDGANPSSGYSFMIGANGNKATRIMKGTHVLAETNKPEALFPDWSQATSGLYQWHRHWWSFRAVKAGGRLQLWYEGKLVVEAIDPNPLPSGRTALWVYDNGILVPRLRIFYQDVVRPRTEPAGQAAWIQPVTGRGTAPLTVTSTSHPSVQGDFEYSLGSFRPADPQTGALLSLTPGGPSGAGSCLAVVNRFSGGHYGAVAVADRLDARDYGLLAFDYRLPPEAKVNLQLNAAPGRLLEIQFSGRPEAATGATMVGKLEGVEADNQWHHVEFDLREALERVLGTAGTPIFYNLRFGNWSNADYLGAGFGGNPAGCTYYLDNFYLGTPRVDATLKLAWALGGASYSGYAVSLDQKPTAPAGKPTAELPAQLTVPSPGLWYLHVQAKRPDGSDAGTVHWAVRTAAPPS